MPQDIIKSLNQAIAHYRQRHKGEPDYLVMDGSAYNLLRIFNSGIAGHISSVHGDANFEDTFKYAGIPIILIDLPHWFIEAVGKLGGKSD